jgi:hypothetical protein
MSAPAIGDEDGVDPCVQMKGIRAMSTDAMEGQPVGQADHLELARLVIEIAWRIDHGKAGTVHELFADDGQMNLGQTSLKGREEIREWGRKRDEVTYRTRHVCTNMRFVADGDDAAEGTTLLIQYLDEGDGLGATLPRAVGEDRDRFVRTEQGWRFVLRSFEQLFVRQDP